MIEYEIIQKIFENEDFISYNKWFLQSEWKNIEITNFETRGKFLKWENGIWINGTWRIGDWLDGVWKNGTWEKGTWNNGIWEKGIWKEGYIWNPKTHKHSPSEVNPNECEWSLSYRKSK